VDRSIFIDIVQDGCQTGGLTRAGGSRDEDDPVFFLCDLVHGLGQATIVNGRNFGFEFAADDRKIAALGKDIDAEPGLARQTVGKVARAFPQKGFGQPTVAPDQIERDDFGLKRRKGLGAVFDVHRHQLAGTLDLHRFADRKVEVGDIPMRIEHLHQDMVYFLLFHRFSQSA